MGGTNGFRGYCRRFVRGTFPARYPRDLEIEAIARIPIHERDES
jgi:hypothetical protein